MYYLTAGITIGIVYVMLLSIGSSYDIIPKAHAQILPFEQQLEQIRNPDECTRKVIQGKSAETPFTLKVVYDTTRNNALEFKQQGTSFPVVQRTNQVMTFYSEEPDQYEIYLEVNYDEAKPRIMYIEYLSEGQIVQSEQEFFDTTKFCMTLFANTVKPTPIPTKEEIFGESLDYISQIPAMVTAFNANSQTSATSIAYIWVLLAAVFVMSLVVFIKSETSRRGFDSKMKDLDDTISTVSNLATKMDDLERNLTKPFNDMIFALKAILALPQVKEKTIPQKKESTIKKPFVKIFKKPKKKDEVAKEDLKDKVDEHYEKHEPRTESDVSEKDLSEEVKESLEATPEEIEEERQQMEKEPSGGFVQATDDEEVKEEVSPPPPPLREENNPMNLQPKVFKDIIAEIDFTKKELREGALEKFTYTELNESFSWISEYRKWTDDENQEIPADKKEKQRIAEEVIYNAIFKKIEERQKI